MGQVIAHFLTTDLNYQVTVADIDKTRLSYLSKHLQVSGEHVDLSDAGAVSKIVEGYELAVGAVPGFLGFQVLESVINSGIDIVDVSYFSNDPFDLDELAKDMQVTAVVDCGIAPGLSNIILGHMDSIIDDIRSFTCFVGGLPKIREQPFEYKAPYSPVDVIEVYTRPARFIENGELITYPALSDPEELKFPDVGTLEAFNTDGLRTLLKTLQIPFMKEKTLRYPGHLDKIKLLVDAGFLNKKPITINNTEIRPVDFSSKILFPLWKLREGEEDITVMRLVIEEENGKIHQIDLFDQFDKESGFTSMARTTGFTCAITADLIAQGRFKHNGIIPPEYIGQDHNCYEEIVNQLDKKNVKTKYAVLEN